MKVTGQFTAPITRKSGAPLALAEINYFSLQRNGTEIDRLAPVASTVSFADTAPLTGSDSYTVETVTLDTFISEESNTSTVIIAEADPAAAITDLTTDLVK